MLQSKPSEGLRAAIAKYGGLLETVVSRIVKNSPQDVEECVADTFVAAWKSIGRLREDSSLKGYLLCIARNMAIKRYHRLKKANHVPLDDEAAMDGDIELSVIREETMLEFQRSISSLPEPDREIILRKYFLFESVKDIAGRLEMGEVQIKNRLYRARHSLRKVLAERGITCEEI